MAESKELQASRNLPSDMDYTEVIPAPQCIGGKDLAFLEELKKKMKRGQVTCSSIRSANMKLQFEITQAQQEIKRYRISAKKIRMANVELKKELFAKEKKLVLIERIQTCAKEYEDLWLKCKTECENPRIQKLMKVAETVQNLKNEISTLDNYNEEIIKKIETKKEACRNVDRERIIQLPEFVVHERPKQIHKVNEKSKELTDLFNEIKLNVNAVIETKVAEKAKTVEEPNVAGIEENKSESVD